MPRPPSRPPLRAPSQPHPQPRRVPTSDIAAFINPQDIDRLLSPFVPDDGERAFVVRCLLEAGPAHHRGANYVLLRLLGLLRERQGSSGSAPAADAQDVPIPLRLPPPLSPHREETQFPLRLPTRAVQLLAPRGSRDFAAMVDCLIDGPPQHALANAAMLCLIESLLGLSDDSQESR